MQHTMNQSIIETHKVSHFRESNLLSWREYGYFASRFYYIFIGQSLEKKPPNLLRSITKVKSINVSLGHHMGLLIVNSLD